MPNDKIKQIQVGSSTYDIEPASSQEVEFEELVVDSTLSSSSTNPVQNAIVTTTVNGLDTRITNLEARGRYLSSWDATTGKPTTYPPVPTGTTSYTYSYKAGDYYVVGTVGSTNKKPSGTGISTTDGGTTWTVGSATESNTVTVGDYYIYDNNSTWSLVHVDTNTHRPIQMNGTEILGNNVTPLNLKNGNGISLANSSGQVTIGHSNAAITAKTTQAVYPIKFDAYGHITGSGSAVTIPTDSTLVHKTGDETIAGTKTFSNSIQFGVDKFIQESDGNLALWTGWSGIELKAADNISIKADTTNVAITSGSNGNTTIDGTVIPKNAALSTMPTVALTSSQIGTSPMLYIHNLTDAQKTIFEDLSIPMIKVDLSAVLTTLYTLLGLDTPIAYLKRNAVKNLNTAGTEQLYEFTCNSNDTTFPSNETSKLGSLSFYYIYSAPSTYSAYSKCILPSVGKLTLAHISHCNNIENGGAYAIQQSPDSATFTANARNNTKSNQTPGAPANFSAMLNGKNNASGTYSTAVGLNTVADGYGSFTQGNETYAHGTYAMAGGQRCASTGNVSLSFGQDLVASGDVQTVFGKWNISDSNKLFIVGAGDSANPKNGLTVDRNGWIGGVGLTDGTTYKTMTQVLAGGGGESGDKLYWHNIVLDYDDRTNDATCVFHILSVSSSLITNLDSLMYLVLDRVPAKYVSDWNEENAYIGHILGANIIDSGTTWGHYNGLSMLSLELDEGLNAAFYMYITGNTQTYRTASLTDSNCHIYDTVQRIGTNWLE